MSNIVASLALFLATCFCVAANGDDLQPSPNLSAVENTKRIELLASLGKPVLLPAGVIYVDPIAIKRRNGLVIRGEGAGLTVVQCDDLGPAISFKGGKRTLTSAVFERFTIRCSGSM